VGLLVGDAVGVLYEFHSPEQIPPRDQIEMTTPVGFRRSHAGVPVGTWSDDGSQTLCLLATSGHQRACPRTTFSRPHMTERQCQGISVSEFSSVAAIPSA
jgi:ADP-ribosylglycohydrolase